MERTEYFPPQPSHQGALGHEQHEAESLVNDMQKVGKAEELLKYLASNDSTLSNKAYEQLMSIIQEKSNHSSRPEAQVEQGDASLLYPTHMLRPQYDDITTGGSSLKQTALLECPKSMVGRVIGKAGETIKALQQYTGAMIQIDQSTDPTRVTIAGSPQSLQLAISMVSDIIKGKFKGFAMLRQIATANEMAQQHGGMSGMVSQPVYVQGYGFMPPNHTVTNGYHSPRAGVSHKPSMYSSLPQQHPIQYPSTVQQQRQYLTENINSDNHNMVLAKLMQLAALEQQRDRIPQGVPSTESFFPDPNGGHHMFVDTFDPKPSDGVFKSSGSTPGLFAGFGRTTGDETNGYTSHSLF